MRDRPSLPQRPQRKGVDPRDNPARDEFDALLLELQPRFVGQLAMKVELLGDEGGEFRRPAAPGLDALGAQPGDDLGARPPFGPPRAEPLTAFPARPPA